MARGDRESVVLEALRPALEEAVAFARRQAADEGASSVPRTMRPLLKLQRLSPGSLRAARVALESDEAFRSAVAEQADPDDPAELPWAWLARAPGWDQQLEQVVLTAAEAERAGQQEREERSAQRRLQQLEAKQRTTEDALARARDELARLRQRLSSAEQARAVAEAEVRELRAAVAAQADQASRSATRAQRAEESLGAARLELRAQQAELETARAEMAGLRDQARVPAAEPEPGAGVVPEGGAGAAQGGAEAAQGATSPDLDAVRAAVRSAAEALGLLEPDTVPLAPAAPGSRGEGGATVVASGRGALPAGGGNAARALRRRPPRPGRGLHADTPEGVLDLLRRPGVHVLVDGYNVAKQQWPTLDVDLQRERLVACLAELGARAATVIDVVFDGADVTVWRRAGPGSPWVRTAFSPPGVEADDEIIRRVAAIEGDAGVVVVTSDRRVQDGAARLGAAVVPSEVLARLLG